MTWLNRRQRDGGLDPIPLPHGVPGRMWLCGKHAIGPDHERLIAEAGGVAIVVCLTERHELADRYPSTCHGSIMRRRRRSGSRSTICTPRPPRR